MIKFLLVVILIAVAPAWYIFLHAELTLAHVGRLPFTGLWMFAMFNVLGLVEKR